MGLSTSKREGRGDPCGDAPYPTPEQTFAEEIARDTERWQRSVAPGTLSPEQPR
jgi:hypothetical protein